MNGSKSCSILKFIDNYLSPSQSNSVCSLTLVMKSNAHLNSLILIMNLYSNRNLPLLATFPTAIAIVSGPCSNNITQPSMYSRGAAAASRSRPYPGAPSSSGHRAGSRASNSGQRTSPARPVPHINPNITPEGRTMMYEEQRENTYRDSICSLCSEGNAPCVSPSLLNYIH